MIENRVRTGSPTRLGDRCIYRALHCIQTVSYYHWYSRSRGNVVNPPCRLAHAQLLWYRTVQTLMLSFNSQSLGSRDTSRRRHRHKYNPTGATYALQHSSFTCVSTRHGFGIVAPQIREVKDSCRGWRPRDAWRCTRGCGRLIGARPKHRGCGRVGVSGRCVGCCRHHGGSSVGSLRDIRARSAWSRFWSLVWGP